MQCKEYITFGDNSKGKVLSCGTILVNESFVLKDVALVSNLHLNLLSVSQERVVAFVGDSMDTDRFGNFFI